jgi:hypothetical protein
VTTFSLRDRLACAAAVLFGRYGDVTRLAHEYGHCRQALYRQTDAVLGDRDGRRQRQQVLDLRQQLDQLQTRCDQLQRQLAGAACLNDDRQAEFAATAQAEGVSLPVCRRLLAVVLGQRAPSVARLGRWTKHAGQRSAALLAVLDEVSRPRVRQVVADELFVRQPILMVAEPDSLCWVSGRLAAQRDGAHWAAELTQLPALQQVTKDGGRGLAGGVKRVNAARRRQGRPAVVEQDDHFHVLREGRRALRATASAARRAPDKAAGEERRERRRRRRPRAAKGKGHATAVAYYWRAAERAVDAWGQEERVWQQVAAAFTLFGPTGELQTRPQAEAAVAAALPALAGPRRAKVRRLLSRPQLWTYLDRAREQLAALPVPEALRDAAAQVEGVRRRPEVGAGDGARAAAVRGMVLVAPVVLSRAGPAGAQALVLVREMLTGVWRASGGVEGVNSVLRMQQSRHRRLTQGLLDLKRRYWNGRRFRTGKRRGQSPYERLGLKLPPLPWWELLKLSPEELRQQLSAQEAVA